MTSEDPIPLDQHPMQSWIGVAHSGGLCTLASTTKVLATEIRPLGGRISVASTVLVLLLTDHQCTTNVSTD